ncbi:helix-turn-helix domain-containing protein [Terrabacter carboxydivorans]|uniref:Helix-turn-helix domain-containing protein n=1 Tax=Terrabacter carboxydivorans TaxID=619730 RepID=A0ABP5Z4J0_9MICO
MTILAERALYAIPDAMALLSMSRSVIYEQIRAGRLEAVHEGRRCYVTAGALERYVALLETEARHRADQA